VKRLRLGLIYGGRSSEHEVSLASAAAICANLDCKRYELVPILIERNGRWSLAERLPSIESAAETIERARIAQPLPTRTRREVHLIAHPGDETLLTVDRSISVETEPNNDDRAIVNTLALDVIFPIVHGPYGEDGTLQGLLELANVPYVGTGVLASAVGMNKAIMKTLFAAAGLPIVKHEVIQRPAWRMHRTETVADLTERLAFPLFVKPASLGSSVGISRATDSDTLSSAIDIAAAFDRTIVVEEGVTPCREIECGVMGNNTPEASVPGEIIHPGDFYDYDAKYLDDRSESIVPAPLTPAQTDEIRRLALVAYRAIYGAGMARVDFLMASDTGRIFLNEVNTHPGFTTISMFAKMWTASGLDYPALLERLIDLATEQHAEKQESRTSIV